jgi:hypothetical protein
VVSRFASLSPCRTRYRRRRLRDGRLHGSSSCSMRPKERVVGNSERARKAKDLADSSSSSSFCASSSCTRVMSAVTTWFGSSRLRVRFMLVPKTLTPILYDKKQNRRLELYSVIPVSSKIILRLHYNFLPKTSSQLEFDQTASRTTSSDI